MRKASGFTLEGLGEPTPFYCFGRIKGKLRKGPKVLDYRWELDNGGTTSQGRQSHCRVSVHPKWRHAQTCLGCPRKACGWTTEKIPARTYHRYGGLECAENILTKMDGAEGNPGQDSRVLGNPTTFSRKDGRYSAIDHAMLINVPGDAKMTVRRDWDLSDHWPIEITSDYEVGWHQESRR